MPETLPGKDPAKTAAIQPTPSAISEGTDVSERVHGSDCALMVLFYLITIITALLFSGRYDTHSTDKIPWVGESNATLIVNNRLQTVESDIESALNSDKWKTLRTLTNMSIDILRTDSLDWPYYVRLTTVVQMKPSNLFRNYLADKLHYTLLRTDNFHVSLRSLFIPEPETQFPGNVIGIFRKVKIQQLFFCPKYF